MTSVSTQSPIESGDLSDIRRRILVILKQRGGASIAELAESLQVSYEAVRQQIGQMRSAGWIGPEVTRQTGSAGRPTALYRLTAAGEHLFPKHYDLLSVELIDTLVRLQGEAGLRALLSELTEQRVQRWAPRLAGLSLEQKLEVLKGIYLEEDPYTTVEAQPEGEFRLIEHNCPFLNVARERPALCSLTVNTLRNLLGYEVVREHKFQDGDGRCAFRILTDRPVSSDAAFRFEAEDSTNGID